MSTLNRDELRKRLAKRHKQLEQRGGRSLVNIKPASPRTMQRISRDHVDLLQNIEFAIADCYRNDPDGRIDDATVMKALRQTLQGTEPEDSPHGILIEALIAIRRFRSDVSDELFRAALRVVMASVDNHSHLAPGETSYLDFMQPYVP
jgi:hypothetical protein